MGHTSSNDYWGARIPRLINYGLHKRLTVRSIKLFADGALGSWGAALIAPYNDKLDTRGLLRTPPETLHKLAERFYEDGFQVVRILAIFRFRDTNVTRRTSMPSVTAQMSLYLTSSKVFYASQERT
jgi:hypothetical protein